MHVVHLITDLDTGGTEWQLLRLTNELKQHQHTVIALTGTDSLAKKFSCPVYSLQLRKHHAWKILQLIWILHKLKPNILHTWLYHADLLGTLASYFITCRLFWNVRCSDMQGQKHMIVRLLAAWSRKPERIVFNSYAGMAYHRKQGYKPWQRMEVIPSGVNTDAFRPSAEDYRWLRDMLKLPPHMLLIGMVARVDPMKDYRTFLVAASICAHADVRFVIVGKGTDELSTYGNQGVYRLGERQDIARILAGLDLFTLTSFSEGCPNVLLEAMASGLPCIASDVGDNAQLLGKEYVIPVHSVSALSQQWLALLQAPTLRQEIGLRNRRHAIERYNMPRVAQKYDQCYSRPSA